MSFLKRLKWPALLGITVLMTFVACEEDPTTIGEGLIGSEPFTSGQAEFEVFAFNKRVEDVQTNGLPVYQVGVYFDPVYGRTESSITSQLTLSAANPVFGNLAQSAEDNPDPTVAIQQLNGEGEQETISEVFLYIPYLREADAIRDSDSDGVDDTLDDEPDDPTNDNDGDTLSNIEEFLNGLNPLNPDTDGDGIPDNEDTDTAASTFANRFDLDSIYGNRNLPFNLKVERSTFFLRDLDPSTSFQESQEYFSSQQFSPAFVSDVLFDGDVTISDEEIISFQDDDPDTEEDESLELETRLSPGIRVPLDPDFFQTNLLDKEGQTELLSQSNFNDFLRGIHLSVEPMSGEDLLLLFDLNQANITVTYKYQAVDINETSDTGDDMIVTEEDDFIINLAQSVGAGNAVNTFINEAYPAQIADNLDTDLNASRIYLKGGAGSYAEIRLFDSDDDEFAEAIDQIRANNWVINEANLVFFVDRAAIEANGGAQLEDGESSKEPARLYLFKVDSGEPLINFNTETSSEQSLFGLFLNYDGIVQTDDLGRADKYSIRITDHINNLVVRDSANVVLGLTSTPDIELVGRLGAIVDGGEEKQLPAVPTITPLGTVLFGSELDPQFPDRRLKLEISFTEAN
ncbi:DUF4270 domain-containing protein [bacterium]|nr:DUF4270 domain-containing protein [bacterium]